MNERRIEELAKQARAWAETAYKQQNEKFTSHWDTPVGYTVTQFFEQKFAELIVRECYETIKKDMELAHIQLIPIDFGIYANGRLRRIIKEHFGVEE
jgi:hypothetical protein